MDLHFRVKIIKLLEVYTGVNLCVVELSIDSFDVTLKAQTKEKIKNKQTKKIIKKKISWTSSKLKTLVL